MASVESGSVRRERRERERALRRDDLIAAASTVFAEKGFQAAQVSEIAAAAELSTKTLYALFSGKEEIYQEVIAAAAAAVAHSVREQVEALDDPRDRMLGVIDSLIACFDENQDLLRIYAQSTHGLPWRVRQTMGEPSLRRFQEFSAWVTELARQAERAGYLRGLEPKAVALSLIGTVTTTAAQWIESDPDGPLSTQASAVRAIFERVLDESASS